MRIMIEMPEPQAPSATQQALPLSVEDKVKHALDMIDSSCKSDIEWLMINKLYKELCAVEKKSPRIENLVAMIEPLLAKFGYHGVPAAEE